MRTGQVVLSIQGPCGVRALLIHAVVFAHRLSELSDSDSDSDSPSSSTASSTDGADGRPTPSPRQRRQFSFPHLDAEIRSALARYDGAVFPKLNWSSPQDAAWMLPGQNLKCQTPADVYLLLKSSDFISHDLDRAFDDCIDYEPTSPSLAGLSLDEEEGERRRRRRWSFELVLKKWFDMPRSQEWRCFVRENRLLGAFFHLLPPLPCWN